MKKCPFFLLFATLLLLGCKSQTPLSAISDPHSVGIDLSKNRIKSSLSYYQQIIGNNSLFSPTDYNSKSVMRKYMREKVITPLSASGLTVEEVNDDYGTEIAKITICTDDLFKTMTPNLSEKDAERLRPIARLLKDNGLLLVAIDCHCEKSTFQYRASLTQQRAERIAKTLTGMGVANDRIIGTLGLSDEWPVADNATSEGKKANRRVEIFICPAKSLYEKILNHEIAL